MFSWCCQPRPLVEEIVPPVVGSGNAIEADESSEKFGLDSSSSIALPDGQELVPTNKPESDRSTATGSAEAGGADPEVGATPEAGAASEGETAAASNEQAGAASKEQDAAEPAPSKERRISKLEPPYCADGAYLIYSPDNNGTLLVHWAKERPDNAIMYAKPNGSVKIPAFKYKGRSELSKNLTRSRTAVVEGALQFLKSMKPYQCRCALLDMSEFKKLPQFILITHNVDGRCTVTKENSPLFNLTNADCAVGVLIDTTAETAFLKLAEKQTVTLDEIAVRTKQNSSFVAQITFPRT